MCAILNHMVQYDCFDASFGALSDATRRGVLEQLGNGDASITALAKQFRMTLTGMKKHVSVLEQAGLVTTEKVGRVRTCKLGERGLEEEAEWIESYRQTWAARLDQLDIVVEELKQRERAQARSTESPSSEIETFERLICGFTGGIIRRAREIPEEKWNWSFSERTPTAREICEHAWMWLRSDRQELTVLDPARHQAIPDPPSHPAQMLDLLESEKEEWRELIHSLDPPMLEETRTSLDGHRQSVRGYLFHMAQHIVSKSGQMTMLHFELGLDGGQPYDAPHPNRLYGLGSPAWPSPRN